MENFYINKAMNTEKAISFLKSGGKITIQSWPINKYIQYIAPHFCDENGMMIENWKQISEFWKIYEEQDMIFFSARCESERKSYFNIISEEEIIDL